MQTSAKNIWERKTHRGQTKKARKETRKTKEHTPTRPPEHQGPTGKCCQRFFHLKRLTRVNAKNEQQGL